ncbi:GAF sensor signal transduction histidine kinase [[Leptolyngbya] sp. PCC 7376]|uniref:GAF domain-containing sensor histidine kinase n=1 Tax=[Leptolyngbya] sp. PCC 7376 TaxID=111781 RepID=UPI00029EE7C4|nr:ATP-binding protein [[Leptolyngbya] sp. PCC 7376]AFY37512.1 GAF sensor signal transduction histidine kinase [[Leptolyngbya] sp. PCC 7376]
MKVTPTLISRNELHLQYWQALGAELIWLQDIDGLCTGFYWRDAGEFGLEPQSLIGSPMVDWLQTTQPEKLQQVVVRVFERHLPEQVTCLFEVGDRPLPLEINLTPILQSDGAVQQIIAIAHQLTGSDSALTQQPSLPRQPDPYQKVLTKVARKIRSTLDLVAIRQEAVMGLGEALEVSRCLLLSYDESLHAFQVMAEYRNTNAPSVLGVQWRSPESPLLENAVQTRDVIEVDYLTAALNDSQSAFVVPTLYQNKVNGFICLQQCDNPRLWSEGEKELTQELAEQLGTAIAHATLYHELEQANQAATEASRLKSDFLASTTHELRTPLNGIIGFLKLILDDMADDREEELEFVDEAHKSAIHLLNLINDILDIAKIESGKIDVDLDAISLSELLENIDNFARPQTQTKGLDWEIIVPDTYDDILLYSNYQRTFQILLNLVSNALKFTHEGGITVSVELVFKDVSQHGQTFPGMVKIKVEDTGIGVALDMQEKLFKSFSQVTGGHTRKYGGTGLGLAISKKLVEAIGGKISFYSMGENLGSTVTFSMPLNQKPLLKHDPTDDPQVIS